MLFGWEMKGRRKRMVELAGMVKEGKEGTMEKLNEILAKFASKVGVKKETAQEYLELLMEAKLIVIQHGEETWKYNQEIEYEIFGVDI